LFAATNDDGVEPESPEDIAGDQEPVRDSDDEAIVAGMLRAPWKWEELVVESAVVGGRTRADGGQRWRRRLDGLAADYRLRIDALKREEPESARIRRFERDLTNLRHLREFALPIVDDMAAWPDRATWGEWLDRAQRLARQVIRRPDRVLETLASLRPMAEVGPVSIEEVRDVLRDRLIVLDWEPPFRRYGRVYVGTPHQARGRRFRVVFVPGLAERVVQRPHEDPLPARRAAGSQRSGRRTTAKHAKRLLLKLSIGASTEQVLSSYPRLDVAQARARAVVHSTSCAPRARPITASWPAMPPRRRRGLAWPA
jgi:hypothetical protein